MTKKWILVAIICSVCLKTHAQQAPVQKNIPFLLATTWGQDGPYAAAVPGGHTLGSWSPALAQILFYHRMQPSGSVNYACGNGTVVNQQLSDKKFDFNGFALKTDAATAPAAASLTAAYLSSVAAVIGEDFGSQGYRHLLNPVPALTAHFNCAAEFYIGFGGPVPVSSSELLTIVEKERIANFVTGAAARQLVVTEIDAKRPVYFHYSNFAGKSRSVAIDGYVQEDSTFWVHLNYGAGGLKNGWYNLDLPIDSADDVVLRAFITIRPDGSKIKQFLKKHINPFSGN